MAEARRTQNIGGTLLAAPVFRDRINPRAVQDMQLTATDKTRAALTGVAGRNVVGVMGGLQSAVLGDGFGAGRDRALAETDRLRARDPETFRNYELGGQVASVAVPMAGGWLRAGAQQSANVAGKQVGDRVAALLGSATPTKAASLWNTVRAAPGRAVNAIARTRAGGAAAGGATMVAGQQIGNDLADPQSEMRTDFRNTLGQINQNYAAGDTAAAAGGVVRLPVEGAWNALKAANPLPTGDQVASFLGGAFGDDPNKIVTNRSPATDTAADAPVAPAEAPAAMAPARSEAQTRAMYSPVGAGLTPQFAQALAGTQGAAPAPQTAPALKDDLMQSLDGLTIRQVVELARARPTAPTPQRSPSAKDQMGYQLLNFMNENLVAALANAQSDEEKVRIRSAHMQQLQSLFGDSLGSLLQSAQQEQAY